MARRHSLAVLLCVCLGLPGCSDIYAEAQRGKLEGALVVVWVGDTEEAPLGDGRFVLLSPATQDPLRFTRPDGTTITPGMIYTDGGSIPRGLQPLRGFSPWGYAPAYMIHDWLFVANRCLSDGKATPHEAKIAGQIAFSDSAVILAEVIKTLIADRRVAPDDVAPAAISAGVSTGISRRLWDKTGTCVPGQDRISATHLAQIEAALPGSTGRVGLLRQQQQTPARIVAQFQF